MKKLITIIVSLFISIFINAQPIPPGGGYNHGGGGYQVPGGGAPIGNGVYILISLGVIWALLKYYQNINSNKKESTP